MSKGMFPTFRKLGDLIERCDLAGWLLLVLGAAVLSVTVLLPPWLENQRLLAQNAVLRRQADLLQLREQNYVAFNRAVERGDPLLMQRLAFAQLHLKPVGTEPLDHEAVQKVGKTIDTWLAPNLPPVEMARVAVPNTKLTRLLMGPTRPWVLAFGGWLMLLGVMLRPRILGLEEAQPAVEIAAAAAVESDAIAEPVSAPVIAPVVEAAEAQPAVAEPASPVAVEEPAPPVRPVASDPPPVVISVPASPPAVVAPAEASPVSPAEVAVIEPVERKLTPVILATSPAPVEPPHGPVHSDAVFDHAALPLVLGDAHDLPHPPSSLLSSPLAPEGSLFDPPTPTA